MAEVFTTIVHLFGSRVARLALCIRGTLGKGTLRMYPSFRVPTTPPHRPWSTPSAEAPKGVVAGNAKAIALITVEIRYKSTYLRYHTEVDKLVG